MPSTLCDVTLVKKAKGGSSKSLKRRGAVQKRRVTVDSAELPRMLLSKHESAAQADPTESAVFTGAGAVEKKSKVSSIRSKFRDRMKTTSSALNVMDKARKM